MEWVKLIYEKVVNNLRNIGRICIVCPNFAIKRALDGFFTKKGFGKDKVVIIYGEIRAKASTYYYINMNSDGRGIYNINIDVKIPKNFLKPKDIKIDIKIDKEDLDNVFSEKTTSTYDSSSF